MTSGAYRAPNSAAKTTRKLKDRPAFTTLAMASPMAQPMGPTTRCAMNAAGTSDMNGTTIMRTTSGHTLVKNFSRYTRTKAASSDAMT